MTQELLKETDVLPLLNQILNELRVIRGLLERQCEASPQAVVIASPKEQPQPRQPIYTTAHAQAYLHTTSPAQAYLQRYLAHRGLTIVEATGMQPENVVIRERMHLGYFIGRHYKVVKPLLQMLRASLQQPRLIEFSLSHKTAEQIGVLTNIADRLHKLHMLSHYQYNRAERTIYLKVSRQPFAHNYLSGGWFEYYVAQASQKLLSNRALLALRNVKLGTAGGTNCEVDLLLVTQYRQDLCLAVLECKSANTLCPEDALQMRRRNSLLNVGMQRSAVVLPEEPSREFAQQWLDKTGAQIIGCTQLEAFLRSLV
ncbi:MAG: hypothetical protein KatS3mg019_2081 [Fimbriimonadales bacterium]|nr:MAG: hypothetical protein KatS3mg019_2081 [Fimbriimonadales bacterium]